ncbi:MAG: hypothetical protein WCV85_06735 [Patescibacteria group bacterium]|jgi:hypothetical protein
MGNPEDYRHVQESEPSPALGQQDDSQTIERSQSVNKPNTKAENYDFNKGWREQLTEHQTERIKNWAAKVVTQWHDEIKPDYVFVTDSSAIPYGYVLKAAWKAAFQGEESIPRFLRVDPMLFKWLENNDDGLVQKMAQESYAPQMEERLKRIISKENPKIIVFDEGNIHGIETYSDAPTQKDYDNFLYKFDNNTAKLDTKNSETQKRGMYYGSLISVIKTFHKILKDNEPEIWGSQQSTPEVLINSSARMDLWHKENVPNQVKEHIKRYCLDNEISINDFWEKKLEDSARNQIQNEGERYAQEKNIKWPINKEISRKPTSKALHSRDRHDVRSQDMEYQGLNDFEWGKVKSTGYIVKHPGQRKRAREYVDELQVIGQEAGEALKAKQS